MFIAVPFKVAWLIRVAIEEHPRAGGDSYFVASSPELPGLLVSDRQLDSEFWDMVCRGILQYLIVMGQTEPIRVIPINHPDREATGYWHYAAIPGGLLRPADDYAQQLVAYGRQDESELQELQANGHLFRIGDRVGVRGSMVRQDFDSHIIRIEGGSTAADASDADAAWITLTDGYRVRPWMLVKLW